MKIKILPVFIVLFCAQMASAQSPQYIPYQAVARDASGNLISNTNICVQFRIYDGPSVSANLLFEEHQSVVTNKLGLFSANVGQGVHDGGASTLAGVSWNSTAAYMEVAVDLTNSCSGYNTMGRSQMMSVPYALYAGAAASATGAASGDLTGTYPGPTIGANKVTYAKIQTETNATVLGNNSGAAASPSELTLGTGLGFSGNSIVNTLPSLGGTVTAVTASAPLTGGTISSSGTIGCPTCLTTGTISALSNPGALIGMSAINGSGTTAMYANAAPAINPAIVPTWTGTHTFSNSSYSALFTGGNVGIGSATPGQRLTVVDGGNSNTYSGTLNVYPNNLSQGIGIGYAGISSLSGPLSFNASGSNTLNLQNVSTGGVAIGTTLSVAGTSTYTGNAGFGTASTNAQVDIYNTANQVALSVGDNANDNGNAYGMVNLCRAADATRAHLAFIRTGNYVWQMGYVQNTNTLGIFPWNFSGTQGTPTMAFSGTSVGIGTASPGNMLDVEGGNIDASGYLMAGGTGGGAVMFSGTTAVNGGGLAGGLSFEARPRVGDWGQWLTLGEPNGTNGGMILQIQGTKIQTGTSTGITVAPTVRNVLDDGSGNLSTTGAVTGSTYVYSPNYLRADGGSFLFANGSTDGGTNVALRKDGANAYLWPWGTGTSANRVYVGGGLNTNFSVSGTKAAVVPTSKGNQLLYCQESPEIWFEDFGGANIENGIAQVALASDFLETVTINEQNPIKVFITPTSDIGNWWIEKSGSSFILHAPHAIGGATFDYRVIAKRKGYENERMEVVDLSEVKKMAAKK